MFIYSSEELSIKSKGITIILPKTEKNFFSKRKFFRQTSPQYDVGYSQFIANSVGIYPEAEKENIVRYFLNLMRPKKS